MRIIESRIGHSQATRNTRQREICRDLLEMMGPSALFEQAFLFLFKNAYEYRLNNVVYDSASKREKSQSIYLLA